MVWKKIKFLRNFIVMMKKFLDQKKHISKRSNNFVFVGQAIYRKGFDLITKAFEK